MASSSVVGSNKDLLDLFHCPVCVNFMYPPIYQCSKGHSLCSDCKPKVSNLCPTCRGAIGDIRSLSLEKVADTLDFPCKYCKVGCVEWFRYDKKGEHEKTCRYRPYKCPFPCCPDSVSGDAETIVSHLKTDHNTDFNRGCDIDSLFTKLDLEDGKETKSFYLHMYGCFSGHFFLQFEAPSSSRDCVFVYLTYVGEETDANKFYYSLELENGNQKMTWQGSPRSTARVGTSKIPDDYNGLLLHRNMAKLFVEPNAGHQRCLRVRGSIRQQTEQPNSSFFKRCSTSLAVLMKDRWVGWSIKNT